MLSFQELDKEVLVLGVTNAGTMYSMCSCSSVVNFSILKYPILKRPRGWGWGSGVS